MGGVIYADILLAINWVVDHFLLVGVAAITGCCTARFRLFLGGMLGACSALIFLAPELPLWGQILYQLFTGAAVLLTAFRLRRPRHFLKLCLWWFLLNFCYSGFVLAVMYWMTPVGVRRNNLVFYFDVSPLLLLGCILAMYGALRLLLLLFEPPASEKIVRAQLEVQGETLNTEVLVDSGFTGRDPMLEQPLLLLSYPDTLEKNTSGPLRMQLNTYYGSCTASGPTCLPPGLRLIPLHTAGGKVLAPACTAKATINGQRAQVTAAFSRERFRDGQVQGLFGQKSYEMIGGR